jgi:hypothetical protein
LRVDAGGQGGAVADANVDAALREDGRSEVDAGRSIDSRTGICPVNSKGAWAPMSTSGAPVPARASTIRWTGRELLVHESGGTDMNAPTHPTEGLYDPCTDTWRPVDAFTGSTGAQFVVLVDWANAMYFYWPAAYIFEKLDILSGKATAIEGAPYVKDASFSYVGTGLLSWGGLVTLNPPAPSGAKESGVQTGTIYDIASGAWRSMSTAGAPSPRNAPSIWTGSHFAVWGGYSTDQTGTTVCSLYGTAPACPIYQDGALYDVVTDTWKAMGSDGAPPPRYEHILAWTGDRLLVWGGRQPGPVNPKTGELLGPRLRDGSLYDVGSGTWTPIPPCPFPEATAADTDLWTGDRLLLLVNGDYDGWLFDPHANTWSTLAAPDVQPGSGGLPAVVQSGAVVLPGKKGDVDTVFLLLPGEPTWRSIAEPIGVPMVPGLLWTGEQLILWGGTVTYGKCPTGVSVCDKPPDTHTNAGWFFTP